MEKMLVFDMDGTLADLYGVEGWLTMLHTEDPTPYEQAKPLYNMDDINKLLHILKEKGYRIAVTSWTAKNGSKAYNKTVKTAKKNWLKKYNFPYDELHCVKYGTTKADCTRKRGGHQILVDDNKKVRAGWTLGTTIDAKKNIIPQLQALAH